MARHPSRARVRMRGLAALVALSVLALPGCSTGRQATPSPRTVSLDWHRVTLPAPPGPAGRLAVRDAVRCGGRWVLAGGVVSGAETDEDATRPAAWASADLETWRPLPVAPVGYWARRSVLSSVGCRDGRIALVGARPGGAHGNPRVSTWYERADGVLVDVDAAFELYGGPQAVNVGRVVGGPAGWLIAGNRTSGAAVWRSPDATGFTLDDTDPQLSSDDQFDTTALDQVADGAGWTVVGSATTPGRVPRVPMAWRSADGRSWQREEVPTTEEFGDLERVVHLDGRLLALGLRGDRFGVWERRGGSWRLGQAFGALDDGGRASPFVSSAATAGSSVLATVSDARRYALWTSHRGSHWQRVRTPDRPTTAGGHTQSVVSDGETLLLLSDDGTQGRAWSARP